MKIARTISLKVLGEGHENDYVKFSDLTFKEAKQLEKADESNADAFMELIKNKLMSGSITDDESKQVTEITKDNIEELPVSVLTYCVSELASGELTANLATTSKA